MKKRLNELFIIDPYEGSVVRKIPCGPNTGIGDIAGTMMHGYRVISIDGVRYKAANLIWFYVTGRWPKDRLDHVDRNRSNDRFENLRESTQKENVRNLPKFALTSSKYKGVRHISGPKKNYWTARIQVDGVTYSLGNFKTEIEAAKARDKAAIEFHGKFAFLNFP